MKKVLLVVPLSTTDWGSKNAGGVDSVCQMLINGLTQKANAHYHYRVVAFDPFSQVAAEKVGKLQQLAPHVELVHFNHSENKLPSLFTQLKRIRQQLNQFDADIVHAHYSSWLLNLSKQYKRIATLHSYKKLCRKPVSLLNDFFYEKIMPIWVKQHTDHFTCVGDELIEMLAKDVSQPITKIGNPISSGYFTAQPHAHPPEQPIRLVTCSLLKRVKQVEKAVELTAKLKSLKFNVCLGIIGPESQAGYLQQLQQLAVKLGVTEQITFHGRLQETEIKNIYEQATLGVYFSKEETFGLAPIEMLAAGLPLLTTKVGILQEREQDFSRLGVRYVESLSDENIETVIRELLVEDNTALAQYVRDNFAVDSIIAQYEALYDIVG